MSELPATLTIKGKQPEIVLANNERYMICEVGDARWLTHRGEWHPMGVSTECLAYYDTREAAVESACLAADLPPGLEIRQATNGFYLLYDRCLKSIHPTAKAAYIAAAAEIEAATPIAGEVELPDASRLIRNLEWLANGIPAIEDAKREMKLAAEFIRRARAIFDAGFRACRSMGDNAFHYHGEQADRIFAASMKELPTEPAAAAGGEAESVERWREACATAVRLKTDYWKALQRIAASVGHEVPICDSQTKAIGISQAVQSTAARLAEARRVIAQHDLCHDLHGKVGPNEFAAGCAAEQRKIYGCAPDADCVAMQEREIERLTAELARLREALMKIEGGYFDTPEDDCEAAVVASQQCARAALHPSPTSPSTSE